MGEVFRARDTKLNRDVALKILPDAFASDPDRLARFTREAQTLASPNHPNIAHIYGLDRQDGREGQEGTAGPATSFIVMELVEGEDLSQKLEGLRAKGSGLPLDEALPIAKQIAEESGRFRIAAARCRAGRGPDTSWSTSPVIRS